MTVRRVIAVSEGDDGLSVVALCGASIADCERVAAAIAAEFPDRRFIVTDDE